MGFTNVSEAAWQFLLLFLVQSTLLIVGVALLVRLLRLRNAAVLSVIYRSVLLVTLAAPVLTVIATQCDLNGWGPRSWQLQPLTIIRPMEETTIPGFEPVETLPTELAVATPTVVPPSESTTSNFPSLLTPMNEVHIESIDASLVANQFSTAMLFSIAKTAMCLLWICISFAFLFRQWRIHARLWSTLSKAVPAEQSIQHLCKGLAFDLNVLPPQVVCSPFFTVPFLAGVRHPVIHLASEGEGVLGDVQSTEWRDVLVHELAHLKRNDVAMRILCRVSLAIFFFQPLLWRLVRWIENSAEDVCDDYAMSLGASRDRYAERLVDFAERCDFRLGAAVGMASKTSLLEHRVIRILDSRRQLSTRVTRRVWALCSLVTLAALLGICLFSIPTRETLAAAPPEPISQTPADASEPTDSNASGDQAPGKASWPQDAIRGVILDKGYKPIAGAEVFWWRSRVHDMEPMQPVRVVTDAKGRFELKRTPPNPTDPAIWDMREEMVVRAKGYAFERTGPFLFGATIPIDPDVPWLNKTIAQPVTMATAGAPITGRLLDIEGQPIANARVRIRWFSQRRNSQIPGDKPEQRSDADWAEEVFSVVQSIEHVPLRDALPMATTDKEGKFQLNDVPSDTLFELLVERTGIQSTNLVVRNYEGDKILTVPQKEGYTHDAPTTVYPAKFEAVIGPSVALVGTVTDAETGQPISGAFVRADMVSGEKMSSSRERQHLAVRTDATGHYRLEGLPIGEKNNVHVFGMGDKPYMPIQSAAKTNDPDVVRAGERTINFQLKAGIWAEGRVYDPDTGKPFQGELIYYWFRNRELEATYPGDVLVRPDGRTFTDSDGRYRLPVFPTAGVIAFSTGNRDHKRMSVYPRGFGENEFAKYRSKRQDFPNYETAPYLLLPGNYNRLALVEPKPGETQVTVDMPLSASKPIPVKIVNPDGTPATDSMEIYGGSDRWGWQERTPQDCVVEDLRKGQSRKVFAFDRKRNLVGGTIVNDEDKTFEIKLAPAGSVHGRLVDSDGQPVTKAALTPEGELNNVQLGVWAQEFGWVGNPLKLSIDDRGHFKVLGLSPEWKYGGWVLQEKQGMNTAIGYAFRDLMIKAGEDRDLGDVTLIKPQ